jgi:type IV pilus biogenesis protein CpaD/CtpE
VVASFVILRAGLEACGDKSLSAGGIRQQRAIAIEFPASILIYNPPASRIADAARELKLQKNLRQVGHTYQEATTRAELEAALASGSFNIIMADVAEVPTVRERVKASSSRAAVVAVGYKLSKTDASAAAKKERFLINAPSRSAQYLDTITEAVRSNPPGSRKV